ncbi:MAG: glycosyltransferase [Candidatus Aenigmarchaeota archaeon]|nr:glycosyltransferase [Candidatus Aenigmarchaeota archaeon]
MIEISAVVPTHNRKSMLHELIEALASQDYPKNKYEIIIVDDDSSDGTEDLVKSLKIQNLIYMRQKKAGPSTARSRGIKKARGRIVALLDDDLIPAKGWLRAMAASFVDDVVAVEGRVIAKGKTYPDSHFIRNPSGGMHVTCNMAFLKSVARFEKRFKYPNREDDDLAFEIIKNGGKIVFSRAALAEHRMLEFPLKIMLKKKMYFEADILLFRKYPELYRKKIKYPFDRFMPFYFIFSILSFLNPVFLALILATAVSEIFYRKYSFSLRSFIKLLITQTVGSFVNVFAIIRGCIKYRVNPIRFIL